MTKFVLDVEFVKEFSTKPVKWGFGVLSHIVFKRTYARDLGDGKTEDWYQTCQRVIEGAFSAQKRHCKQMGLPWSDRKAQRTAQEAYRRMFDFKWLPPGRGLWMMGTDFVENRSGAALNNCGFVSTKNIDVDFAEPFCWLFEMSMLGVGVGFDQRGSGKVTIQTPIQSGAVHVVEDSREGWCNALRVLLNAYVGNGEKPSGWDVSGVRKKGEPIVGFGGVASGPAPLIEMLGRVDGILSEYIDKPVNSTLIVDIMNLIGKCVVSGGVRRTAEIALGDPDDSDFLNLKLDFDKLADYRWTSNNSIFARIGMDYTKYAEAVAVNGEPGFAWLDNMRKFGRMKDAPDFKDYRALGGNPCLEQTLEDRELCCLVETFPANHDSLEDFKRTLKFAYMYAKTVTLFPTHDKNTNAVMMRNRRIGCSMSGIAQNIAKVGMRTHLDWCDEGYAEIQRLDKIYSEWLCIPRSIKTTSVKPSGTVSLLAGATPGIHHGMSEYIIRRVRVADSSPIWKVCKDAGYLVDDCKYAPATKVVSFPVKDEHFSLGEKDLTMWEQLELAALHQEFWADNQVSCTVKFFPHEAKDLARALSMYEHRLKGISFLPQEEHGYEQAPYEEIDAETYAQMVENIKPIIHLDIENEVQEKFCDSDVCVI